MANLVVSRIEIKGPADTLDRVHAAIETSVIEVGEGGSCLKQYYLDRDKWAQAFPDWGDKVGLGLLESCYTRKEKDSEKLLPEYVSIEDARAVRIVDGTLCSLQPRLSGLRQSILLNGLDNYSRR